MYCTNTDSTKMGTDRVLSYGQKISYLFLQDIKALKWYFSPPKRNSS